MDEFLSPNYKHNKLDNPNFSDLVEVKGVSHCMVRPLLANCND